MAERTKGALENFQSFNINEHAYVTLTPVGHEVFRRHYGSLQYDQARKFIELPPKLKTDERGTQFQLYDLLHIFGPSYEQLQPPLKKIQLPFILTKITLKL